jgi:hypothetical protein
MRQLPKLRSVGRKRRKKTVDHDTMIEEDLVDNDPAHVEDLKLPADNNDITTKDDEMIDEPVTPLELESDLGPYWTLAQSCQAYVLNTITSYSNIVASKSTPQYGFNRGLKEFGVNLVTKLLSRSLMTIS